MIRVSPGVSHVCLKSTLLSNAQTMLKHCQALDTFVGDNVIQKPINLVTKYLLFKYQQLQVVIH